MVTRKVNKLQEDCLAIFKPGLWQIGFSDATKSGTIFQQELMVSKLIVKLFS